MKKQNSEQLPVNSHCHSERSESLSRAQSREIYLNREILPQYTPDTSGYNIQFTILKIRVHSWFVWDNFGNVVDNFCNVSDMFGNVWEHFCTHKPHFYANNSVFPQMPQKMHHRTCLERSRMGLPPALLAVQKSGGGKSAVGFYFDRDGAVNGRIKTSCVRIIRPVSIRQVPAAATSDHYFG